MSFYHTQKLKSIRYSQNFIISKNLSEKFLKTINLSQYNNIVEIGPGRGILTESILSLKKRTIAIEKDECLYNYLLKRLVSYTNLKLINDDFLKFNLDTLNNYIVIGNIPFSITSQIINKLVGTKSFNKALLIVQKEAAIMYGANSDKLNTLKSLVDLPFFTFKIVENLDPRYFKPKPRVLPVILLVERRDIPLINLSDKKNYINYIKIISHDRFGFGNWKKIFTKKQIKYLEDRGLIYNKGISHQPTDIILLGYKIYSNSIK